MRTVYFVLILGFRNSVGHDEPPDGSGEQIVNAFGETRRILRGSETHDTRPYMVYLRAAPAKGHIAQEDPNWLCGGVIIHPKYILTSAACIEDVGHFYVISGTHRPPEMVSFSLSRCGNLPHEGLYILVDRWLPLSETNECITQGAVRAVWKCVPKTYRYDGHVFNNIRWMVNDIAVVMVESEFSFTKRVKGCDFIPQRISYNNQSLELEQPGTMGFIAGWGSSEQFTDAVDMIRRTTINSPNLMEAEVIVVKKASCKNHWLPRYHAIIDKYMICGKNIPMEEMSQTCDGKVECRQLVYSEEQLEVRRANRISKRHLLRSMAQFDRKRKMRRNARRSFEGKTYGGFCENDHGGPLITGYGRSAVVIGIISAYRNKNNTNICVGPFLYTSVWNNRHLINCALYKQVASVCTSLLRMTGSILDEEHIDWSDHDRKNESRKHWKPHNALRSGPTEQLDDTPEVSNPTGSNDHEIVQGHEEQTEMPQVHKEVKEVGAEPAEGADVDDEA